MTTKEKLISKLEELRDSCGDNLGRDGEVLSDKVSSALALAKLLPDEQPQRSTVSPLTSRPWMDDGYEPWMDDDDRPISMLAHHSK